MGDQDRQIGRTVMRLRGAKSQQALADEMRARGWKWSQATVWAVEKGDRPLRLAEAADLAHVLEVQVSWLLFDSDVDQSTALSQIVQADANIRRAEQEYEEAKAASDRAEGVLAEAKGLRRSLGLNFNIGSAMAGHLGADNE